MEPAWVGGGGRVAGPRPSAPADSGASLPVLCRETEASFARLLAECSTPVSAKLKTVLGGGEPSHFLDEETEAQKG